MSVMVSWYSKPKFRPEVEAKVTIIFNQGTLTSGMKGGVQILKTPQ